MLLFKVFRKYGFFQGFLNLVRGGFQVTQNVRFGFWGGTTPPHFVKECLQTNFFFLICCGGLVRRKRLFIVFEEPRNQSIYKRCKLSHCSTKNELYSLLVLFSVLSEPVVSIIKSMVPPRLDIYTMTATIANI
mgnify:CR=1 FL=1